ncbi:MAG: hypothetical protein RR827_09275, partial [Oscillospiraceae bacterium]
FICLFCHGFAHRFTLDFTANFICLFCHGFTANFATACLRFAPSLFFGIALLSVSPSVKPNHLPFI